MIFAIFLGIDIYFYQAIRKLIQNKSSWVKWSVRVIYVLVTISAIASVWLFANLPNDPQDDVPKEFLLTWVFVVYISKSIGVLFLLGEDISRLVRWLFREIFSKRPESERHFSKYPKKITRKEFVAKSALVAGSVPLLTFGYGIVSGAHDYHLKKKVVKLPNLPRAWDGVRIGQISDIHSGSFFNKTAVKGGVEMLMGQKPDLIFFTGDLVNSDTDEANDYIPLFSKVQAPLGVYSTLGNHDYGDYKRWPNEAAKQQNFKKMLQAHKALGWKLMMNENDVLFESGDPLAILGIENWGTGRFPKYGRLDLAYKGTEDYPTKLLLSHDPSHWDAEVRPNYPDIDLMFAGHTHGFQFGVEWGNIKWSPAQYRYKQWAGLYSQKEQHLYVNRGYGYLGFPGRVGIPPEITIIELRRA